MKLITACKICGRILSVVEKDEISQDDIDSYEANSICAFDFTEQDVPILDENGDPVLDDNGDPEFKIVITSEVNSIRTES